MTNRERAEEWFGEGCGPEYEDDIQSLTALLDDVEREARDAQVKRWTAVFPVPDPEIARRMVEDRAKAEERRNSEALALRVAERMRRAAIEVVSYEDYDDAERQLDGINAPAIVAEEMER